MKRILSLLLALTGTFVLLATIVSRRGVPPMYAQAGCTVANLNGNYAFTDSGFAQPRGRNLAPEVPVAAVGVLKFDGTGNVSFKFTLAVNGDLGTPSTASTPAVDTGTYTVNPDCTDSMSFTGGDIAPLDFNMVIIGGGDRGLRHAHESWEHSNVRCQEAVSSLAEKACSAHEVLLRSDFSA